MKSISIRCVSALIAHMDLELHQMNVKTTFLNGDIDEDISIEIPEGYYCSPKDLVCKVVEELHETKQVPRCWNINTNVCLVNQLNFLKCGGDVCFYVKQSEKDVLMVIAFYVDNLFSAASETSSTRGIKC